MNILFWNCNAQPVETHIAALAVEHDIDLIVLAEYSMPRRLFRTLNQRSHQWSYVKLHVDIPSRIEIFVRGRSSFVTPLYDLGHRCRISEVTLPLKAPFTLVAVHLASKLFSDDFDQAEQALELAQAIDSIEDKLGHTRTVVIGDFNMDPFERGLVSARAFNAVTQMEIALRQSRVHDSIERKFFYNPMWKFYAERPSTPAGTYYRVSPGGRSIYWHILDQVLLRPRLLENFSEECVMVLDQTKLGSLIDENRRPSISDHLPILLKLNY